MGRSLSHGEVKAENIKAMGEDLGELYTEIWKEVAWLHLKWSDYVELYGKRKSRLDLLNKAARRFFRLLQDIYWEDILLHIARLTDNPKSAGKDTLTIQRFPQFIEDEDLLVNIQSKIEVAIVKSQFCRDWRNRHIAHRDLELVLNKETVEPLKSASRLKVKEAIYSLGDALNTLSKYFKDSTTIFDIPPSPDGAISLLHVLDDGMVAIEDREKRIRAGIIEDSDLKARDI
jgi:hypothetical protein